MLTVDEAVEKVIATAKRHLLQTSDSCPITSAHSVMNSVNIYADRDFPPFDRVAMDGIAMVFDAWFKGQRKFSIQELQGAGVPPAALEDTEQCIEVMTGAVLPVGTDTVVRYEDLHIEHGMATIDASVTLTKGQNVHRQGSDRRRGDLLIAKGTHIASPQWAVIASVGIESLPVAKTPSISIIGTGDELVAVHEVPQAHQIRASNIFAIAAALRDHGFHNLTCKLVRDDPIFLEKELECALASDVCILTGAVSAGKFDFVPSVLQRLGVREIFHKVKQRPGKPLWFGESKHGIVFGLPGNPVSALIGCYRFVLPALVSSKEESLRENGLCPLGTQAGFSQEPTVKGNQLRSFPLDPSLPSMREGKGNQLRSFPLDPSLPSMCAGKGNQLRSSPLDPSLLHRFAQLTHPIYFSQGKSVTLFAPVSITYGQDAVIHATPVKTSGSGDLASLLASDGFVECSLGKTEFLAGDVVPLYTWSPL